MFRVPEYRGRGGGQRQLHGGQQRAPRFHHRHVQHTLVSIDLMFNLYTLVSMDLIFNLYTLVSMDLMFNL